MTATAQPDQDRLASFQYIGDMADELASLAFRLGDMALALDLIGVRRSALEGLRDAREPGLWASPSPAL